jgi:hypothetical protein
MIKDIIGYVIVIILLLACARAVYKFFYPTAPEDRGAIGCLFFVMLFAAGCIAGIFGI